jgi:hypothetical protein
MRCERYWREGILLVERGRPDPHRESCLDCRREHEARNELVRAFAQIGAYGEDPRWQERVWKRIDRDRARRPAWVPWATSGLAVAAATAIFLLIHPGGGASREAQVAAFAIIPGDIPTRSGRPAPSSESTMSSTSLGSRARIRASLTEEARIYRGEALILRCTAASKATPGCSIESGMVQADHMLSIPGRYRLVIAPAAPAGREPAGTLDRDLAAIMEAGFEPRTLSLVVR